MKKDDEDGVRPIHRPRDWNAEERRIEKRKKRYNWSTRGGFIAPIIVPSTPNGELLQMLKEVAEQEAVPGLKFKVLEKGGLTVQHKVQRSNPSATPGCQDADCLPCKDGRGKGGCCRRGNVQYQMECQVCNVTDIQTGRTDKTVYIGETSRNLYTRAKEHINKNQSNNGKSYMKKHQEEKHSSQPAVFDAKVTGSYKDCLSRQVAEGVAIRRCEANVLNSKSEWHQPALWRVRSELERL